MQPYSPQYPPPPQKPPKRHPIVAVFSGIWLFISGRWLIVWLGPKFRKWVGLDPIPPVSINDQQPFSQTNQVPPPPGFEDYPAMPPSPRYRTWITPRRAGIASTSSVLTLIILFFPFLAVTQSSCGTAINSTSFTGLQVLLSGGTLQVGKASIGIFPILVGLIVLILATIATIVVSLRIAVAPSTSLAPLSNILLFLSGVNIFLMMTWGLLSVLVVIVAFPIFFINEAIGQDYYVGLATNSGVVIIVFMLGLFLPFLCSLWLRRYVGQQPFRMQPPPYVPPPYTPPPG
jgi:hypothetical protein